MKREMRPAARPYGGFFQRFNQSICLLIQRLCDEQGGDGATTK